MTLMAPSGSRTASSTSLMSATPCSRSACDEPAGEARVGSNHRVLNRVRDDEQQHQVEGGHLAELARTGEPETGEQREVHDRRAKGDVEQDGPWSCHPSLTCASGRPWTSRARSAVPRTFPR